MCLTVVPGDPPVSYRISSNNGRGGGTISFFASKGGNYSRGGDYSREVIISNTAH